MGAQPAAYTIVYDDRLVEAAVLGVEPSRPRAERVVFRRQRDPLYEIGDPEERERRFRAVHNEWFRRWHLDDPLATALHERPLVTTSTARCLVSLLAGARDEGADIFGAARTAEDAALERTVVVKVRPERFVEPTALLGFLRHELLHVADMLDPAFGYHRTAVGMDDASPTHERLLRDRYRVVWDATVDGRLVREGRAPASRRADRWAEFDRTLGPGGPALEAAFARWFDDPAPTHGAIAAFVREPAGPSPAASSGVRLCPVCRFPTTAFENSPESLPAGVRAEIARRHGGWTPRDGVCVQCADLYLARDRA
jgi:hypothetical protein